MSREIAVGLRILNKIAIYEHLEATLKFLSKLAELFAKGLQIWMGFSPVITAAAPGSAGIVTTVSQDLTEIATVITDTEQMAVALQLKGPDKLKAAAPLVADIILKSTLLANHKIADPVLFNQGVSGVASGMADIINSLSLSGISTTNKAQ